MREQQYLIKIVNSSQLYFKQKYQRLYIKALRIARKIFDYYKLIVIISS
ncbi:hypothetical protein pb186bvf_002031 [Paramecium bursaria]